MDIKNTKKIKEVVGSQKFKKGLQDLIISNGLTKQKEAITALIHDIVTKKIPFPRLGAELDKVLGEDHEKKMNMVIGIEDLLIEVIDLLGKEIVVEAQLSASLQSNKGILDQLVKELLRESKVKISDEVLFKRFQNIAFSWFRDVRDDFETKETVTRETRVGGLGFTDKNADNFLAILKKKKAEYKEKGIELSTLVNKYLDQKEELFRKEQTKDIEIDVPETVAAASTKPMARAIEEKEKLLETHEELPPPSPTIVVQGGELKGSRFNSKSFQDRRKPNKEGRTVRAVSDEILQQAKTAQTAQTASQSKQPSKVKGVTPPPKRKRLRFFTKKRGMQPAHAENRLPKKMKQTRVMKKTALTASGRPKVEDIKFSPKLYGPIDELASLSVDGFRRLAEDPEDAAQKLSNKLELLEEESLMKKAEGIKALRSSGLYRAYTKVLQQSVTEGKTYEQVLDKNPVITLSELRAIMNLNKKLKA